MFSTCAFGRIEVSGRALTKQVLDAEAGQQHRRGEARAAAADDQYRHLLVEGARLA